MLLFNSCFHSCSFSKSLFLEGYSLLWWLSHFIWTPAIENILIGVCCLLDLISAGFLWNETLEKYIHIILPQVIKEYAFENLDLAFLMDFRSVINLLLSNCQLSNGLCFGFKHCWYIWNVCLPVVIGLIVNSKRWEYIYLDIPWVFIVLNDEYLQNAALHGDLSVAEVQKGNLQGK